VFHLSGDLHIPSLVLYGIYDYRDLAVIRSSA
jgi:hypothetical protein